MSFNSSSTAFQSTLLMRGATTGDAQRTREHRHFNPRSSCEERLHIDDLDATVWHFNPRSSCEERLRRHLAIFRYEIISIHAPHARSDFVAVAALPVVLTISIHAPHARSDFNCHLHIILSHVFQSTLLMRGATGLLHVCLDLINHFNPRSSCEERRGVVSRNTAGNIISIHAPHARSDKTAIKDGTREPLFQSTLLMRGATVGGVLVKQLPMLFQSTLLMRGATGCGPP